MSKQRGIFTVSLDFELHWGMTDRVTVEDYKENLLGVRSAVPSLLELFDKYKIHVTWATVGFLFFATYEDLIKGLPDKKPNYVNRKYSSYNHINHIGPNEQEDPFHYAPSLINMILSFPHQEIGTHTFSHYYCLEKGQDVDVFRADLEAAVKAARRFDLTLECLIFPRNQFNNDYLTICREMGIKAYRGTESSWIHKPRSREDELLLRRGLRLLDAYLNIFSHNCYSLDSIARDFPLNIPSSRFLRPYSNRLKILEPLRLQRICADLTYAAKKGLIYHLNWHPHNFGTNLEQNLTFLKKILAHYSGLQETYGMESLNMREMTHRLVAKANTPKVSISPSLQ